MGKNKIKKMIYAALFLAIGILLPFLTAQIKEIGDSLLPMHIPVMLCGFLCGWGYGGVVGLMLPFLRSLLFSMPPFYPNAIWMATELATYGLITGILHARLKNKGIGFLYLTLICSMLAGRVTWGVSKALLLGLDGKAFGIGALVTGGFLDAIPGIVLQLILIPPIVRIAQSYSKNM